jgi:hypothetical protein
MPSSEEDDNGSRIRNCSLGTSHYCTSFDTGVKCYELPLTLNASIFDEQQESDPDSFKKVNDILRIILPSTMKAGLVVGMTLNTVIAILFGIDLLSTKERSLPIFRVGSALFACVAFSVPFTLNHKLLAVSATLDSQLRIQRGDFYVVSLLSLGCTGVMTLLCTVAAFCIRKNTS